MVVIYQQLTNSYLEKLVFKKSLAINEFQMKPEYKFVLYFVKPTRENTKMCLFFPHPVTVSVKGITSQYENSVAEHQ